MTILIEMIYRDKEPVPALRARHSEGGQVYTPAKYASYKKALCNDIKSRYAKLRSSLGQDKTARFGISILVYTKRKTGDWDNYAKAVQDALQDAGVINDDKQIDIGFCAKHVDASDPRIEFILYSIPDDKSENLDFKLFIYNFIKGGQIFGNQGN